MKTWKKCGHPRTPENTVSGFPGTRCRTCRLDVYSRYNASAKGRDRVGRYRVTGKGIVARFRAQLNTRRGMHVAQGEALGIDVSNPAAFDKAMDEVINEALDMVFASRSNVVG